MKSTVELNLMQRPNGTQYFEVWVRSSIKPELRRGSIIERDFRASTAIEILAGALAEDLAESYNDSALDPSEVARFAREAWRELDAENPIPALGTERRL